MKYLTVVIEILVDVVITVIVAAVVWAIVVSDIVVISGGVVRGEMIAVVVGAVSVIVRTAVAEMLFGNDNDATVVIGPRTVKERMNVFRETI